MMKRISNIFSALLLAMLLTGCWEDRSFNALLDGVDSLMERRPDSALLLLQAKADTIGRLPQSQQMRYHLLTAKAQNKAYVDFTTDSLMRVVADYYDHHGSPNDRMMAHYLLGCCYRDMGEAPATIECYKDAVNLADTTRQDCDFRTLMSIYGQIARLYDHQAMPMEELEALERSGWYALKCGDTLNYIRSIQLQTHPYNLLQDTSRIFEVTDRARALFLKHGYVREAAAALPLPIAKKIEAQQYKEAHSMMQIYENQSGRFDENGDIQPRYSHYYANKGLYYLGIHKLDSAEIYFRKLLAAGHVFDAYRGLEHVYQERKNSDSVFLYSILSENALDQLFTEISTQSVRQTEAMYDYARNQQIAYEEKMKREKAHRALLSVAFLFILSVIAGSLLYRRKAKEKAREISRVANQYLNASSLYERAKGEMEQMELNHVAYQQAKQAELDELRDTMERYRIDYDQLKLAEKRAGLEQSDVVTLFRDMAQMKAGKKVPTKSDWNELQRVVSQARPDLYAKIAGGGILSEQELQICLLTSLGFSNSDQTILLNVVPQRITNAKRRIGEKLFSDPSARSLEAHLSAI